jgi:hypothetical protein
MKMHRKILVITLLAIAFNSTNRGKLMALDNPIDVTNTLNKRQFEVIVQYILDKGEMELYFQLWGYRPFLSINAFLLLLPPTFLIFDIEYQKIMRNNVSHYQHMTIGHFEGTASAGIAIRENNRVVRKLQFLNNFYIMHAVSEQLY